MAFGQDFLNGFFGNDYLRDYTHASKIFRTNGYSNSPRLKFLFHVYFNLNTNQIPQLRNAIGEDQSTIGLLVKNIDLPSYNIDVETLNQYNRKRLVQKKIEYQPITATFHDDGGDLIRLLWYNYYSYYYKDPSQPYRGSTASNGSLGPLSTASNSFDYNSRDIYVGNRQYNDWGYIGESYSDSTNSAGGKPAFFTDISIYGFNQHRFVEYVLINPLITGWDHDNYDYSQDAGVMENRVKISYETVKYYSGAIGGDRPSGTVKGFGAPSNYDLQSSTLKRPGGTRSILGQGGLLDTGVGIMQDLESGTVGGLIGAVQKAGVAYNTFKGANFKSIIKEEAIGGVQNVLRNTIQGTPGGINTTGIQNILNRPIFPTPSKTAQTGSQSLGSFFGFGR